MMLCLPRRVVVKLKGNILYENILYSTACLINLKFKSSHSIIQYYRRINDSEKLDLKDSSEFSPLSMTTFFSEILMTLVACKVFQNIAYLTKCPEHETRNLITTC